MLIQPVRNFSQNRYETHFKAKPPIIDPSLFEEQLKTISKNKETRELFTGLTAIAGAVIAEITLFAEQNKEAKNFLNNIVSELGLNELTEKYNLSKKAPDKNKAKKESTLETTPSLPIFDKQSFIEERPERELYFKITSFFPNLDSKYKQLLSVSSAEPENKKNERTLNILENILRVASENNDKLTIMKSYIKTLDEYSDCLDDIATNISSTLLNGNSVMYYLVLLNNGKLSKDSIKTWAEAENLSCDEFMMIKQLDKESILKINEIKKNYPSLTITDFGDMLNKYDKKTYAFRVGFPETTPAHTKLKAISAIHEAVYGEINLKENTEDSNNDFLEKDVQTEMVDNLLKDRRMESIYNFARFIDPKAFKNIKLSSTDVKFLQKEDNNYQLVKDICSKIIFKLDFENPRFKEFCNVINNKEIFGEVLTTRHSRIRFVSRFVLKNNHYPQKGLEQDCREKAKILKDALETNIDKANCFCYINSKGSSPQFYLKAPELGKYIKVTLNNNGTIHTIYEDAKKEIKDIEEKENKKAE